MRLRFQRTEIVTYLRDGMPYFYVVALTASYSRLGVILLTSIGGEAATGAYAAAERLVSAIATIYSMFYMALLPVITQLWKAHSDRFAEMMQRSARLTLLVTLPATTFLALFARDIVHILYGGGIPEAATVLAVIAWVLLARGFVQLVVTSATATDHQPILVRGRIVGIVLLTVAGLALIPAYGPVGLAGATLVGESAAVLFTYQRLRRAGVPLAVPPGSLRAAIACLLTAGCVWLAGDFALPWRLAVAAGAMSAGLWLSGAVRSHDFRYLRAVLRGRDAQP
jgi:O-antigen/teichoic acid export membrane protein